MEIDVPKPRRRAGSMEIFGVNLTVPDSRHTIQNSRAE